MLRIFLHVLSEYRVYTSIYIVCIPGTWCTSTVYSCAAIYQVLLYEENNDNKTHQAVRSKQKNHRKINLRKLRVAVYFSYQMSVVAFQDLSR